MKVGRKIQRQRNTIIILSLKSGVFHNESLESAEILLDRKKVWRRCLIFPARKKGEKIFFPSTKDEMLSADENCVTTDVHRKYTPLSLLRPPLLTD